MRKVHRIDPGIKLIAVSASMLVLGATFHDLSGREAEIIVLEAGAEQTVRKTEEPIRIKAEPIRTYALDEESQQPPYNSMSADWGSDDVKYGYYEIPEWCKAEGGCFPKIVQAYTQCLCEQKGISYPMVLALIERESKYRYDAVGDSGNSKGYMQIYQKWHEARMEELNCTDLLNPYQNIKVGIDYLAELTEQYGDESLVLMLYNRGARNSYGTGAIDLWEKGVYETEYSRTILDRKAEIEEELGVEE